MQIIYKFYILFFIYIYFILLLVIKKSLSNNKIVYICMNRKKTMYSELYIIISFCQFTFRIKTLFLILLYIYI